MIIRKIETINDSSDIVIYVSDKNEIEKQYIVTDKKVKEEKFEEGDRVAEETDGSLREHIKDGLYEYRNHVANGSNDIKQQNLSSGF